MLNCFTIILNTGNQRREILVSPLLLQSKERPDIKSGKINKLFFYENWIDDEYKTNLKQEHLSDKLNTDRYLINYGQDFEKFYLGCLNIDFEKKVYSGWIGATGKFNDNDVKCLGDSLFGTGTESRIITIFTPTRPSDINLGRVDFG